MSNHLWELFSETRIVVRSRLKNEWIVKYLKTNIWENIVRYWKWKGENFQRRNSSWIIIRKQIWWEYWEK